MELGLKLEIFWTYPRYRRLRSSKTGEGGSESMDG